MAQGVRVETEAGVWVRTPTCGLVPYFLEIMFQDYIGYEWETQIRRVKADGRGDSSRPIIDSAVVDFELLFCH